ncbi:SMI1/KNR4 family protein [Streptomyces sp. ISL-10]|uniref:SMI1/KNR4 family protein n=1 Tax=Streptomyces sp. ISL-10 TaxID=2819172 RepID=UPI001BE7796E|nr:SMI1/KNR4 family protein [Streptomyces sp. ISL-10]MBT2364047.1 SMI1/KNR4 family protein [Streptomyces sp. ISL-10]
MLAWLEEHAPASRATLGGPATQEEIRSTEARLGVEFPVQLREFLQINNGHPHPDDPQALVGDDCHYVLPCAHELLNLSLMEKNYDHQRWAWNNQGDGVVWDQHWIPFASDEDGMCGMFIDVRTGEVGKWGDYGELEPAVFPSLAAFFVGEFEEMNSSHGIQTATFRNGFVSWID